jgi:hypothetical protein
MIDSHQNPLAHETAPLAFDDLEWLIQGLMGSDASQAEALIVSQWCWDDEIRTGAQLAARWPTESCFFAECHKAYELAVDLGWTRP